MNLNSAMQRRPRLKPDWSPNSPEPELGRQVQPEPATPACTIILASGIEDGGTTPDGLFTVAKCECLGACADAPVMLVNDRQMLSFMTEQRLDELIDTLKKA